MKLKQYVKPASLQEAIALLRSTEGPVTLLAGGTDVLVYGREGDERYADHTVVDIYGLPELRGIEETEDALLIGAGTTHTEVEQSPLVQRYADVLACACRTVGSLQIRNHATIGGNVGNASPAADSFAALAVLEAETEINRLGEVRREPLSQVIARNSSKETTTINAFHDNGTGVLLLGERWESPAELGGRELLFWLRCNGFPVESSEDNESVFPAQAADAALAEDFAGYDPSVLRESEFYDAASDSYRIRFVGGRGLGNRWWLPYHSVQPDGIHRLALSGASTDSLCSGVLTFRETGDGGVQFLDWNGSTAIR